MSEGELWKNTTVWWNINPEEWSLSLGYHQYLMWGQMGLNCHCKDLTAFYVRWLEKVVCLLWKAFYIGGCVPLAECPPNKDGRMCVSQYVSHPSHQFGLQGGFYLSARWWGGASKAYCAPLLCAAECCLFGLADPVADVWAHVEWTTKPHSQQLWQNLIGCGFWTFGWRSMDFWNPCTFLLWQNICSTQRQEVLDTFFSYWIQNSSFHLMTVPFTQDLKFFMRNIRGYLLTCCTKTIKNLTEAWKFTINTKAAYFAALPTQCTSWSALASDIQEND